MDGGCRPQAWLVASIIVAMTSLSCEAGRLGGGELQDEDLRPYLYVDSTTIWPSPVIPVCWENPTDANAEGRQWTRQGAKQWEDASAVRFHGWGPCTSASRGIRILIDDSTPRVRVLGSRLDGIPAGMVLNFTFNNWGTSCRSSEAERSHCVSAIALHEFGHALGFAHEQNRPDTPSSCDCRQGSDGNVTVGPWDLHSAMNYCNPTWVNGGVPSETDGNGVRKYYGAHVADSEVVGETQPERHICGASTTLDTITFYALRDDDYDPGPECDQPVGSLRIVGSTVSGAFRGSICGVATEMGPGEAADAITFYTRDNGEPQLCREPAGTLRVEGANLSGAFTNARICKVEGIGNAIAFLGWDDQSYTGSPACDRVLGTVTVR